ncbi:hypothetical protein ACZ11_17110 [Lysinibacillus xylanilyticus]|uniref:Uncharacterized protein n=1 Tax=Lysinibacillus xylanilyticus TaxID=582475 RepID=A0A0K9F8I8_9BACI|nr:hypothetical protein [Lysinibacillus xylanilyticus]KMY30411.1 hypothetical protein ACZ11_17110 [Lysinibacillus xylanilyticus]
MSNVFIRNEREQQLVQYALELAQQIDKTAGKYDESGEFSFEHFNFFQRASKHPLKEVKASGGCRGIGKEFLKDVNLKSSHPCDNG